MTRAASHRGRQSRSSKSARATACRTKRVSVSTADKIAFVDRLSAASLPVIEVSAFVSPKWVPQMADAAEVFAGITRRPASATPRSCRISPASSARSQPASTRSPCSPPSTETFSRKNINQSIDESLADLPRGLRPRARGRACACAAICRPRSAVRIEGDVAPERVADVAARLLDMGVFEVAVSDTIGIAHPGQVPRVLDAVLARVPARAASRCTFTTRAARRSPTCSRRCRTASRPSMRRPAASAAVPYAPGAAGNLATEDLIYMLEGWGSRRACRWRR